MAGRIPQHFIDDLIARSDIVEIIGSRIALKKAGKEYKVCCPFHNEKTPSFTVSPSKQFYHCFGCGAHGTVVGFLMEHDRLEFVEAIEDLAARAGLDVPHEAGRDEDHGLDELFGLLEQVTQFYCRSLKANDTAIQYLKKRGLSGENAKTFGIGYAPAQWDALLKKFGQNEEARKRLLAAGLIIEGEQQHCYDRFRNRIMFPIRDTRGRTVGFGGRVIDDAEPKYLNSPETALFHKGRELYGLFEARRALTDLSRILVVEGYTDVVALAQHDIRNAVATLGTATTPDHIARLFRAVQEIVFCFDGDDAGRRAAWRAMETVLPQIRDGRQVRFLFLPEGEDPDSMINELGQEAFEKAQDESVPLSEFLTSRLASQVDMGSVDGRARLAELAVPLVRKIPRGVYRELMIGHLAGTVGMSAERLGVLVGDAASEKPADGARATASSPAATRSNLVRQAISLMLHYPQVAAENVDRTALANVEKPGVTLITELLEDLRSHPQLTTAGLLERWRDRDECSHLTRLAAQEMLVLEEAAAAVFRDTVESLIRQEGPDRRTETLLAKASAGGLTADEKQELRELLGQRQGAAAVAGNES